jgi:hypothetical protein
MIASPALVLAGAAWHVVVERLTEEDLSLSVQIPDPPIPGADFGPKAPISNQCMFFADLDIKAGLGLGDERPILVGDAQAPRRAEAEGVAAEGIDPEELSFALPLEAVGVLRERAGHLCLRHAIPPIKPFGVPPVNRIFRRA